MIDLAFMATCRDTYPGSYSELAYGLSHFILQNIVNCGFYCIDHCSPKLRCIWVCVKIDFDNQDCEETGSKIHPF